MFDTKQKFGVQTSQKTFQHLVGGLRNGKCSVNMSMLATFAIGRYIIFPYVCQIRMFFSQFFAGNIIRKKPYMHGEKFENQKAKEKWR